MMVCAAWRFGGREAGLCTGHVVGGYVDGSRDGTGGVGDLGMEIVMSDTRAAST